MILEDITDIECSICAFQAVTIHLRHISYSPRCFWWSEPWQEEKEEAEKEESGAGSSTWALHLCTNGFWTLLTIFFCLNCPLGEFPGFLVWSKLIVVLLYRSIPLTTSAAFQCYPGQGPALNMRTASSSTNFTPFRSEICHPNLSINISFHRLPLCQLAVRESYGDTGYRLLLCLHSLGKSKRGNWYKVSCHILTIKADW